MGLCIVRWKCVLMLYFCDIGLVSVLCPLLCLSTPQVCTAYPWYHVPSPMPTLGIMYNQHRVPPVLCPLLPCCVVHACMHSVARRTQGLLFNK